MKARLSFPFDYPDDFIFKPLISALEVNGDSLLVRELSREGLMELCVFLAIKEFLYDEDEGEEDGGKKYDLFLDVYAEEIERCFPKADFQFILEREGQYMDMVEEGKDPEEKLVLLLIDAKEKEEGGSEGQYLIGRIGGLGIGETGSINGGGLVERVNAFIQNIIQDIRRIVYPQMLACSLAAIRKHEALEGGGIFFSEEEMKHPGKTWVRIIFFMLLGLFGAVYGSSYLLDNIKQAATKDWEPVTAYFQSGSVRGKMDKLKIAVSYSYVYGDKKYESDQVGWYSNEDALQTLEKVNDLKAKKEKEEVNKKDIEMVCYVNPKNPGEAVLFRDAESDTSNVKSIIYLISGLYLFILGILGLRKKL